MRKFEGWIVVKKSYFCAVFFLCMKMRFFPLFLACVVVVFMTACSKDFNSNAPYRDATVVYGILNADDNVQYVKIYKGFLTNDNAYEAAQIYDSLYYFDKITVELEEYRNGHKISTHVLDTTTAIPRDLNGDMSAPKQMLYVIDQPINVDNTYKLVITNKETGRVVTAETTVVGETMITSPFQQSVDITHKTTNYIKYKAAMNASAYTITQTFNYVEIDKATGDTTYKSLRRNITPSPTTQTSYQYVPYGMYEFICSSLTVDNTVDRYLLLDSCICFEVWAVNEPYYNYVQTSTITSSVVMDHLVYTNVECADDDLVCGFFGSRRSAYSIHRLNTTSEELIVKGNDSRKFNFHYSYELLGH